MLKLEFNSYLLLCKYAVQLLIFKFLRFRLIRRASLRGKCTRFIFIYSKFRFNSNLKINSNSTYNSRTVANIHSNKGTIYRFDA